MSLQPKEFYEFDDYRVDAALGRLHRESSPVVLPPKAFDLLLIFVRNPNRVLSKTELMEALWPDTFVEDANLTQHVFTLRKALGVRPRGQPYIETVPRRGYCFAAPVRQTFERPPRQDAPTEATRSSRPEVRPTAFDGERKQATVLFCGAANAALLAERLGPEGFDDLMHRVSDLAADEIGRYEGILRQRQPDEFVALFGARVVHEDDARRAVLAALGIQRRLRDIVPAGGPEEDAPVVRIGIHSGPVVVNRRAGVTGVEYTAVGETMRTADLLQQVAEPGAILVSDVTRRVVEGYVDVAPVESGSSVVSAFRVVGVVPAAAGRRTRLTRTLAPFVGRQHEVSMFRELAAKALGGSGQVVGIVGEPGMGKSRLIHECSRAAVSPDCVTLLEGRCVSYGSLVPYLPLADLIRTHCGLSESDTPEDIRRAVERAVRDSDLPPDTTAWLLRLIGIVDPVTALEALSPEAIKARTFDVLRALFLKASTRRPLVIIVEDVHWIDRTSEEFLSTLIERLVAARVMLVTTTRPGYRAPWMDRSYATQITLAPLAATDSAALVSSMDPAQRLPEGTPAAILAKAEGNPFFLEELARAVVEHGPEGHGIPDTIHAVIMARMDRLADGAKQLLQTAAVLGREVPLRLLKRVWRNSQIDADLIELCRLEFLYERPGGDEPVFVFKHALTQDVAYDSLLARRRRDLHLEAARALEELYSNRLDEVTARLAYHYTRTEFVDEAVTWLIRAAEQAARVYANAEAVLHLDLARRRLERLPDGADRDRRTLHIVLLHAHSLYFLGRFTESVEVLLPHAVRLGRLNDPALTSAYSFWLAHMYSRLGDQQRACESALRAIDAATRAGDQDTLGKAHGVLALEGHWSGNTADGLSHGEEAVRLLSDRRPQRWWLGMAHFYVAMNHLLAGNFDAALLATGSADGVGKEIGDPRLQTYAGFTAGWIEATRGNHEVAAALCRRSRDQAPDRVSRAYASMVLGYALIEGGQHSQAQGMLEPIVAELEGFGFPQWHGFAASLIADACRREGSFDRASSFVERALEVTTRSQYRYGIGFAQRVVARIARDEGALERAAEAFERAAATFERIGAAFEAARTRAEGSDVARATQNH